MDDHGRARAFHELPLVGFTALVTAGAGLGAAHLLLFLLAGYPLVPAPAVSGSSAVLVALGLLVSAGHLGRPWRAPMALSRLGRSPLSNEVAVVALSLAASAASALSPGDGAVQPWLALAFVVAGVLTLLALGMVYRLPGQLTWGGAAVVQPLLLGTAFGLVCGFLRQPSGNVASLWALVVPVLAADGVLAWWSLAKANRRALLGRPSHPGLWKHRRSLLLGRGLLGLPIPLLSLALGEAALATAALSSSLFLDRVAFYGLAVRGDTEAEVARVEEILRAIG